MPYKEPQFKRIELRHLCVLFTLHFLIKTDDSFALKPRMAPTDPCANRKKEQIFILSG